MNTFNGIRNPCAEIPLGKPEYVQPWLQVNMMQAMRMREGLTPWTPQEMQAKQDELQKYIDENPIEPVVPDVIVNLGNRTPIAVPGCDDLPVQEGRLRGGDGIITERRYPSFRRISDPKESD